VKNAKVLARTVAAQTSVSATTVLNLLRRNAGRPTLFVPIVTLREAAYKKAKPVLYPVPGLVFQRKSQQLTPTPTYARQVLGRVGEATAEDLKRLGPGYLRGDQVGQTGLERAYERELAGRPSGTVSLVRDGHEEVVVRLPGVRPEALRSTLDRKTQNAAEAALGGMVQPAALVAVSVRTGRVLAVANRPTTQAFNRGVLGRYPPGSTFKVVTAAALLAAGRTPTSALSCPPTLKVSGRTFRNSEGERLGRVPLSTAFALSCNTAFIGAARVLAQAKLLDMAHRFGFGATGGAGAGGQLPKPKDSVEYVADAIGQGRVTASPLHMATVAATAASGQWRAPAIVIGVPGSKPTQVAAVPRSVIASLRALMRAVVTGGTGVAANVPGAPVHGKTGTAEFGGGSPPKTHAWFIGFRGDVAFAVLVEAGGVGGRVAAPIAARFLRAL
jgi:cell division protein FtsI/penicillin-binding protein 2